MDSPLESDSFEDSLLESAAANNELVKFVNKVIIDAFNMKVSDIHVEPMPGKAKTGIRFRIDGSLQFDIELRVATIPSAGGGDDVVLRLMGTGEPLSPENLGLTAHNLERDSRKRSPSLWSFLRVWPYRIWPNHNTAFNT